MLRVRLIGTVNNMGTEYVIYKNKEEDYQLSLYEMSSQVDLYVETTEDSIKLGNLTAQELRKLAQEIMKVAYYCDGNQPPEQDETTLADASGEMNKDGK